MCDYSLEMYGSRPAREGELYTTTRFPSGSIGFASAGDPRTAVCMQCDTKVMLTDIPAALQTALRVGAEAETTFAQREAGLYRDGLRLADGRCAGAARARRPEGPGEDARGRRLKIDGRTRRFPIAVLRALMVTGATQAARGSLRTCGARKPTGFCEPRLRWACDVGFCVHAH